LAGPIDFEDEANSVVDGGATRLPELAPHGTENS